MQIIFPNDDLVANMNGMKNCIKKVQESHDSELFLVKELFEQNEREVIGAISFAYKNPTYCVPEKIISFQSTEKQKNGSGSDCTDKDFDERAIDEELNQLFELAPVQKENSIEEKESEEEESEINRTIKVMTEIFSEQYDEHIHENKIRHNSNILYEVNNRSKEYDAFYIKGDISIEYEDHFMEYLNKIMDLNKDKKPIIIDQSSFSQNVVEELNFKYNVATIDAFSVDMQECIACFDYVIKSRGDRLSDNTSNKEVIQLMRKQRGVKFSVSDYDNYICKAEKKAKLNNHSALELSDFNYMNVVIHSINDEMDRMIGLDEAKEKLMRSSSLLEFEMMRSGPMVKKRHMHVAFAGNPGTGKTEFAHIFSECLTQIGISNGKFINASKSDYVGQFLGHTAKLMRKLFEKARGGVIFFDECSTFLTREVYTEEALTELVRYMEKYPDVICIFASYKSNIEKLLERDQGLKSRITEIFEFSDYTDEEIYKIFEMCCQSEGFEVEDSRTIVYDYVDEMRNKFPESFGNGRLARNISEKAIEMLAVETIANDIDPKNENTIYSRNVEQAIESMKNNAMESESVCRRKVGFDITKSKEEGESYAIQERRVG